jgi:hypothetical protein
VTSPTIEYAPQSQSQSQSQSSFDSIEYVAEAVEVISDRYDLSAWTNITNSLVSGRVIIIGAIEKEELELLLVKKELSFLIIEFNIEKLIYLQNYLKDSDFINVEVAHADFEPPFILQLQ